MSQSRFFLVLILVVFHEMICFGQVEANGAVLFEQARFSEAAQWFQNVLRDPEATREDIVQAHLYLAAVDLVGGADDSASTHVAIALALDDTVTAPAGSPLRLEEMIGTSRESGTPMMQARIELPERPEAGTTIPAEIEVSGRPRGLATSLEVSCSADGEERISERTDALTLAVDVPTNRSDMSVSCSATTRTESGAVVLTERATVDLRAASTSPQAEEGGSQQRSRRGLWLGIGLGTGTAVVAAIVAIAAGLAARPDYAEIDGVTLEVP